MRYLKLTMKDKKYTPCALGFGKAVYDAFLETGRCVNDGDLFDVHDYLKHMWYSFHHLYSILWFGKDVDGDTLQDFDENFELSMVFDGFVNTMKRAEPFNDTLFIALGYVEDEDERVFVL